MVHFYLEHKRYINDHSKKQYQSKLQVNHYNNALLWNIIIYFPVSNRREPWYSSQVWRSENSSNQTSSKIDALPFSYICVKNFLAPFQTLAMPSRLPPTPFRTTPDSNYRNEVSEKVA